MIITALTRALEVWISSALLLIFSKISTIVGILVTPWRTIFWRRSKQRSPWGRQAEQQAMGTVSKRDPGFRFNGKSFPSCIQWTSLLHLDIRVAFNIENHEITTALATQNWILPNVTPILWSIKFPLQRQAMSFPSYIQWTSLFHLDRY